MTERKPPPALSGYLEDRPLLWFESAAEYDALLLAIIDELDPNGALEYILTKDVVDYLWEAARLRRLRRDAVHAKLPDALASILGSYVFVEDDGESFSVPEQAQEYVIKLAHQMLGGNPEAREEIGRLMQEYSVDLGIVHANAYKAAISSLRYIEGELGRYERRRDQVLSAIVARRAAFRVKARHLIEAQLASVEQDEASESQQLADD